MPVFKTLQHGFCPLHARIHGEEIPVYPVFEPGDGFQVPVDPVIGADGRKIPQVAVSLHESAESA
mgnify:CR=1 FL=1